MMIILALSNALYAAEPRHEMSVELSSNSSSDPSWAVLGVDSAPTAIGIRGGFGVTPWLTVIGSYHRGSLQSSPENVNHYYEDSAGHQAGINGNMESLLSLNHIGLGGKFSTEILPWFVPYATVQAQLGLGALRISDDLEDEDALIGISSSGMGYGGLITFGAEARSKPIDNSFGFAAHMEFGYGLSTKMNFTLDDSVENSASIGDLGSDGFVFRTGVGLRF